MHPYTYDTRILHTRVFSLCHSLLLGPVPHLTAHHQLLGLYQLLLSEGACGIKNFSKHRTEQQNKDEEEISRGLTCPALGAANHHFLFYHLQTSHQRCAIHRSHKASTATVLRRSRNCGQWRGIAKPTRGSSPLWPPGLFFLQPQ